MQAPEQRWDSPACWQHCRCPADKPMLVAIDESGTARCEALQAIGFSPAGRLPAALNMDESKQNLLLLVRSPAGRH